MRLWQIERFEGADGLVAAERPDPSPGPGQVVLRVVANSLNYRDLMVVLGKYRAPVRPGLIPLSDGAGEVVAVGAGVTRVKPGDKAAAIFHQGWIGGPVNADVLRHNLGGSIDGMLAEYVVLSEQGLVKLPSFLSYEEAATLPCAGVTAWTSLTGGRPVTAGETVLVQGSGGVSIIALQLAKAMGARVLAITSSADKAKRLRELGADLVFDYVAEPDWDKRVLEATGKRGADRIVEVGGPGTFLKSVKACAVGGRIAVVGALSGYQGGVAGTAVDPAHLVARGITIESITVGSRADFEALCRAIEAHHVQPVIDREFTFADAPAAFAYFEGRGHFGKVVISA